MARTRDELTEALIDLVERLSVSAGAVAAAGWPDLELTMPQLRALVLLRQSPCRMGAIAEHLGTGLPAATSMVERLEAKGLVERRPDAADRRVVCCHLTTLGRDQLEQFWRMEHAELAAVADLLTVDELDRVVDAVALLAGALDRHQTRGPIVGGCCAEAPRSRPGGPAPPSVAADLRSDMAISATARSNP